MPLPDTNIQEQLSLAYCHAVVSFAGFTLDQTSSGTDFGIDGYVSQVSYYDGEYVPNGAILALQMKATHNFRIDENENVIKYSLKMTAYRKLLAPSAQQKILVLYTMPSEKELWIDFSQERLLLQRCAYWLRASDLPRGVNNVDNLTISIPLTNLFTVDAVHTLAAPALAALTAVG